MLRSSPLAGAFRADMTVPVVSLRSLLRSTEDEEAIAEGRFVTLAPGVGAGWPEL
jgi:hypothetical protein